MTSGVSYELVDRWDAERLNQILQVDTPEFFGVEVNYTPASNGVTLYRITYATSVPAWKEWCDSLLVQ